VQNQKFTTDLMACAAYVNVDMSVAALHIVGPARFLASANAFMLPGTAVAPINWKKFLLSKEAHEVPQTA
jgi:hypothetical protein